jgi:hypothetical protein
MLHESEAFREFGLAVPAPALTGRDGFGPAQPLLRAAAATVCRGSRR